MGQRPPPPFQEIEVFADGKLTIKFAQEDRDMLEQELRLLNNAYRNMRRVYTRFELPLRARTTLDFPLHADFINSATKARRFRAE